MVPVMPNIHKIYCDGTYNGTSATWAYVAVQGECRLYDRAGWLNGDDKCFDAAQCRAVSKAINGVFKQKLVGPIEIYTTSSVVLGWRDINPNHHPWDYRRRLRKQIDSFMECYLTATILPIGTGSRWRQLAHDLAVGKQRAKALEVAQ
jgi:hypothetical protein